MSDSPETAPAASQFEQDFNLLPLGDDVAARVERLEAMMSPFLKAAIYPMVDGASILTFGSRADVPAPDAYKVNKALDAYRPAEAIAARHAAEEMAIDFPGSD